MFMGRATVQDTKSPEYSKQIRRWDSRGNPQSTQAPLHLLFPMLPKPSMKQDTHLC